MKKHVICHIHCLDHPGVYKIVKAIVDNIHKFDGEKIATITKVSTEIEVYNNVEKILKAVDFDVIVVDNDPLREVNHFFNTALPRLLEKTSDGILYYCHSKGISYHPESEDGIVSALWTDVLLEHTLYKSEKLPFDNTKYKTFGSCRIVKNNFLPDNIGEKFSYIGTFYWVRVSALANKKFAPKSKFYLEALPGLVATQAESFNIGPAFTSGDSPYKLESWEKRGIKIGLFNKD